MTIATETNQVSYTGNGATTAFPFSYPFLAAADLVVIETVIATGVQTLKALTTHYTVSGTPDATGAYTSGGTVNALVAPAGTLRWTIYNDPDATQPLDLVENDPLPAESIERAFDRLTMIAQRNRKLVSRSLRQPDGDSADIDVLPAKVNRASMYLAFDADGDPVASPAPEGGNVVSAFIETLLDDADAETARATLGVAAGPTIAAQTADYTVGTTDNVTDVITPASASATATLPAASSVAVGWRRRFKNATEGKGVVIARAGSDTIDGATSFRVPGLEVVEVTKSAAATWIITLKPSHRVGDIIETGAAVTTAPPGYVLPYGQALSRTDYKGLFDEYATAHGAGDGSTTFGMLDKRGRASFGKDDMGGSSANRITTPNGDTLGATGGAETKTLSAGEIPPLSTGNVPTNSTSGASVNLFAGNNSGVGSLTINSGSAAAFSILPPMVIVNCLVKA